MKYYTLIILFFLPLNTHLLSQGVVSFRTWLEKEVFEDQTIVRGWFENQTIKSSRLSYKFTTKHGDDIEVRENNFFAEPRRPQRLSKAVAFFSIGQFDLIKLEIYDKEKTLIAVDSLTAAMLKPDSGSTADFSKKKKSTFEEIEIDGLIIDETRSKTAHDFYEYFYNKWSTPPNAKGLIITIRELPNRGTSARIAIEINDQKLVERHLQPRGDVIEATANQVVAALQKHLKDKQNVNNQIDSGDISGSGIY